MRLSGKWQPAQRPSGGWMVWHAHSEPHAGPATMWLSVTRGSGRVSRLPRPALEMLLVTILEILVGSPNTKVGNHVVEQT